MRSTSERGGRTRAYSPSAIFIWLAVVRRCRAAILTPASFLFSFSSSFTFSLFLFTFPSLLFHSSSIFTSSFFTVNHVTARVYRIDCIFADKYQQIRVVTKDQAADGSRWLFYKFLIFSNILLQVLLRLWMLDVGSSEKFRAKFRNNSRIENKSAYNSAIFDTLEHLQH